MGHRLAARWNDTNCDYRRSQGRAADIAGALSSASRAFRMLLQSFALGLGAYLVIKGDLTAGVIIASSILISRAVAPIELAIANWRGFVAARQSWYRLGELLARLPAAEEPLALPAPQATLAVENVSAAPPGERRVVLQDVGFTLEAGAGLGVTDPVRRANRPWRGSWSMLAAGARQGASRRGGAGAMVAGAAGRPYRLPASRRRTVRRNHRREYRPVRA